MRRSDAEASRNIDTYVDSVPPWSKKIGEDRRAIIPRAAPALTEAVKWNSPCFCARSILCGFMALKKQVTISFWNGVSMRDGHGLCHHGTDNRCGRGIDFFEADKVPKMKFERTLEQLTAGKRWYA